MLNAERLLLRINIIANWPFNFFICLIFQLHLSIHPESENIGGDYFSAKEKLTEKVRKSRRHNSAEIVHQSQKCSEHCDKIAY